MKKVLACTVAVSLLFRGVPTPMNAGVVAGVATEWTQILNHVQLVMNYIRMGVQLQIEMQQLSEQLKQGKGLPSQIFGSIQQDLGQLAQIVQGGQALAYSMGNLDAQFRNTFPGYSSRTSGYFNDYKKWSQTSLDTTNQIAEQQVEQLMALRQLMLVDLQSKQAYQAEQIQKEQADKAALEQVFGTQPLVTDHKKY